MARLLKRSVTFGVGKEIGGAVYVHRLYENVLPEQVRAAKALLPSDFLYTVVKFDLRYERTSFIHCPDFDSSDEPTVGASVTVEKDGSVQRRNPSRDPFIYHHKWLFVRDDYSGFDVQASQDRSRVWTQLAGVDVKRIGRRSYWIEHVVPRISDQIQRSR